MTARARDAAQVNSNLNKALISWAKIYQQLLFVVFKCESVIQQYDGR